MGSSELLKEIRFETQEIERFDNFFRVKSSFIHSIIKIENLLFRFRKCRLFELNVF